MERITTAEPTIAEQVRILQIIKFALITGVTVFAVYLLVLAPPPQAKENMILLLSTIAFGAIALVARLVVPALVARNALRQVAKGTWRFRNAQSSTSDLAQILAVHQIQMLVGSAILESAAFANLVSAMITGHVAAWILSGILWLGLVIDFPTKLSLERWVESKLAWINDERRLGDRVQF